MLNFAGWTDRAASLSARRELLKVCESSARNLSPVGRGNAVQPPPLLDGIRVGLERQRKAADPSAFVDDLLMGPHRRARYVIYPLAVKRLGMFSTRTVASLWE